MPTPTNATIRNNSTGQTMSVPVADLPKYGISGSALTLAQGKAGGAQPFDLKTALANALPTVGGIAGGIIGSPLDAISGVLGTAGGAAVGGGLGELARQAILGKGVNPGDIAKSAAVNGIFGLLPGSEALGAGERGVADLAGNAANQTARNVVENAAANQTKNLGSNVLQTLLKNSGKGAVAGGAAAGVSDIGTNKNPGQVAGDIAGGALGGGALFGATSSILGKAHQFLGQDLPESLIKEVQDRPGQVADEINNRTNQVFKTDVFGVPAVTRGIPDNFKVNVGTLDKPDIQPLFDPNADRTNETIGNIVDKLTIGKKNISDAYTKVYEGTKPDIQPYLSDIGAYSSDPTLPPEIRNMLNKDFANSDVASLAQNPKMLTTYTAQHGDPFQVDISKVNGLQNRLNQLMKSPRFSDPNSSVASLNRLMDQVKSSALTGDKLIQKQALDKQYGAVSELLKSANAAFKRGVPEKLSQASVKQEIQDAITKSRTGNAQKLKNILRIFSAPVDIAGYTGLGFPGYMGARVITNGIDNLLATPDTYAAGAKALQGVLQNRGAQAVGNSTQQLLQQLAARAGQPNNNQPQVGNGQ